MSDISLLLECFGLMINMRLYRNNGTFVVCETKMKFKFSNNGIEHVIRNFVTKAFL